MKGLVLDIDKASDENTFYRKVIYTTDLSQLVLMSIGPGQEIGMETHSNVDQFIRIEDGKGVVILDGENFEINDGFAFVIPAGVQHNVINTSDHFPLKLYSLYTAPEHPAGTVHMTKEDSIKDEGH